MIESSKKAEMIENLQKINKINEEIDKIDNDGVKVDKIKEIKGINDELEKTINDAKKGESEGENLLKQLQEHLDQSEDLADGSIKSQGNKRQVVMADYMEQ